MSDSSIKQGAIISYLSIFLSVGITLLYTPWMIKEIGISDYGIYTLIIAFISYFLLDFGLGAAISRFIAKYRAEGDEQQINKMLGITTRVYFYFDIAIFCVIVISYFFISDIFVKLTPDEIEKLKKVYLIAGFFSTCNFIFRPMNGAMLAYEYFVGLKMLDMIQRLGTVVMMIIALQLNGGLYALVLVNGGVALLVSISKYLYFTNKSGVRIQWGYFDKVIAKQLFVFSFWVFIISLTQRFRLNLILSVLGMFSGTSEISVFSIGISLEAAVFMFAFAINGLFMPKISRMVKEENSRSEIDKLMIRVGRIQLYIVGFIIVGFIGFGQSFMALWLGDSFAHSYYVTLLLILPNIISMTQQIADTLAYVENRIKYNAAVALVSFFISLLLAIVLSEKYGAIGGGVAIFVALTVELIILNVFYQRRLGLNIIHFFKKCHLKIVPYLTIFTLALILISNSININSWGKLIICCLIYTLLFSVFVYLVSFNKEEKGIVKIVLTKCAFRNKK